MCTEGATTEPPLSPDTPIGPSQLGYLNVRLLVVTNIFIAMVNFVKEEEEVLSYDGCCSKHATATTVTTPSLMITSYLTITSIRNTWML